MKNPLVERPWLLIVAALAVFVVAWVVFLVVAELHKPAEVPRPVSTSVRH
ncbi:MAG TPA: hypothetical protein PK322_12310 [Opitutaceae bacterium]|nr:hypothetical protein [Opitutaceae bacterium]